MITGIAYYKKEDYNRFLSIIADRESMHDSWEEWYQAFLKTRNDLISQGIRIKTVEVDLDELIAYCARKEIKNDGKARSQFALDKVRFA